MLEAALTRWVTVIELFFAAPGTLLSGSTSAFSIVGAISVAFLVLGALLALVMRVRQAIRLILPALGSLISPFLFAICSMVGTIASAIFVFVVGSLLLLIWIASIARDAARRKPAIWLAGIGILGFALLGIMVEITLPVSLRAG
jgi:hypothetical protein